MTMKKADIAVLSEKIRKTFDISTPVDLNAVIKQLGGKVLYLLEEKSNNKEPYVKPRNNHGSLVPLFEIGVLKRSAPQNQINFSTAHELGHLFLHLNFLSRDKWPKMVKEGRRYSWYGSSKNENEANTFSSCFLMPEKEFRDSVFLNTGDDGYTDIDQVADHFQVPYSAVLNRGRCLKVFDWV